MKLAHIHNPVSSKTPIRDECDKFITDAPESELLDFVKIAFQQLESLWDDDGGVHLARACVKITDESAIKELNDRFREHDLAYQFVGSQLVRVDSQYLHDTAVKPALGLLHDPAFKCASGEFVDAHEHYRHGRYEDAITNALKAFESTMNVICDVRGWPYPANATASKLVGVLLDNELVSKKFESHLNGVRTALESGVPTIRNNFGGHGAGSNPVDVPDYLAAHALQLAAANIVILVEAHKATTR